MPAFDFDVLQCPLCSRQLVPMELDFIIIEGEKYQRIWWTCSGLRTQSCEFPTSLPEDVFWTQRSMKQMRNGFFPLPNLHLLPPEYWHLYPKLFDSQNGFIDKSFIGHKKQKLVSCLPAEERLIKKHPQSVLRNGEDCVLQSLTSETFIEQSVREGGVSTSRAGLDENLIVVSCSANCGSGDADLSNISSSSVETGNELNESFGKNVEAGSVNSMNRISRKYQNLIKKRKLLLEGNEPTSKRNFGERRDDTEPSVPFEAPAKCKSGSTNHGCSLNEGVPVEKIFEEKELLDQCNDCFNFLRHLKEEPLEGVSRRGLSLEGMPTAFRPEHFPSSVIDPQNWYRQVHLCGRTALDGFMAWYNLRYNRKQYLEVLAAELCKKGVMKYVPSIPIKQQRMVKQLREEVYGKKCVDIEGLKKNFDSNALRLQMAHRLGVPNVEPLVKKPKLIGKSTGAVEESKYVEMRPLGSVSIVTAPMCNIGDNIGTDESFTLHQPVFIDRECTSDEALKKRFNSQEFSNFRLPKESFSMMSNYLTTGDYEIDEVLHQKVIKQMQQALNRNNSLGQNALEVKRPEREIEVSGGSTAAKQRRVSEVSQGKDEELRNNLEGLLDDYYDEDEEFCTQIYG